MGNSKKNGNRKQLGLKILNLFGRGDGQYIVLTKAILAKELGLGTGGKGEAEFAISSLLDELKVASLDSPSNEVIYLVRGLSRNRHVFRYTSKELVTWLNSKYFNRVAKFLEKLLAGNKPSYVTEKFLEKHDGDLGIPAEILKQIINCFVEAGLVKIDEKTDRLSAAAVGQKAGLSYDAIKNAFIAQRFTGSEIAVKQPTINSFDDLRQVYNRHDDETRVKTLKFKLDKPEVKVQVFAEALIGHQDWAVDYLERELELLEKMLKENLPDVLIISGIIQGGFQHQEKDRRLTLALKSENQQFKVAKMVFDRCLKLGIKKIVYNVGDDDQKLWMMHTVDALMIMQQWRGGQGEAQKDSAKISVNYKQLDDLKQSKAWDFHYNFQARVVHPYMLRCGRRLYSADEVEAKHGRRMEEYLMLLETHAALKKGQPVPDSFYNQVLEVNNIPLPGKEFTDFEVTADFNMEVTLSTGKVFRQWERHDFNLTPTAMKQDPLAKARTILGQLAASGVTKKTVVVGGKETIVDDSPNVFAIEHQEQCFGVLDGKTWVISHPSLRGPHLDRDSTVSQVQKDKGKRILTTRGELPSPATQTNTVTSDGRYLVELHNDRLLNKMNISKERVAVVLWSDWQTGSVTARSDLQALNMDYVFHQVMPKYKTVLVFDGDIIQGRNYPEMPNENVRMGLVRIHDQQEFVRQMIKASLKAASVESLRNNLVRVMIAPGNHEWNSSHKNTGDTHSLFLVGTLQDFMEYNKISAPVKYYDKVENNLGGHWNSWVALEQVAGYTVAAQHYILAKGGKGGSGAKTNPARQLFAGTGDFYQEVDVLVTGHFHSPSYQVINNKIVVVNGSWADESGYELELGYRPMMGSMIVYLGGGLPPVVEIITQKTLHQYTPKGFCSEDNLAKLGFVTDKGFEPRHHGFARKTGQPQSAVQKWLWRLVDDINWTMNTTLGPHKK